MAWLVPLNLGLLLYASASSSSGITDQQERICENCWLRCKPTLKHPCLYSHLFKTLDLGWIAKFRILEQRKCRRSQLEKGMLCSGQRISPPLSRSPWTKYRCDEHAPPRCKRKQSVASHRPSISSTARIYRSNTSCRASGFCFDVACQREKDVLFALSIALPIILAAASFLLLGRRREEEVFLYTLKDFKYGR